MQYIIEADEQPKVWDFLCAIYSNEGSFNLGLPVTFPRESFYFYSAVMFDFLTWQIFCGEYKQLSAYVYDTELYRSFTRPE